MSTTGEIKNLYSDKDKTKILLPRTKTKAISDENGTGLDVLLNDINTSIKKAAPVNLLDNSDFRNPVNQRGNEYVTSKGSYPIDRWKYSYDGDAPHGSAGYDATKNYVYLINDGTGTGNTMLYQKIPIEKLKTGKYTIAIHQAGVTNNLSFLAYANGGIVKLADKVAPVNGTVLMNFELTQIQTELTIYIYAGADKTICIDWVALYESEYTIDTLPEYQPKGYAAEFAECLRYYRRSWSGEISSKGVICLYSVREYGNMPLVNWEIPMRINPTVTIRTWAEETEYQTGHIRNWETGECTPVTVNYGSEHGFAIKIASANKITLGTQYCFHYEASADL